MKTTVKQLDVTKYEVTCEVDQKEWKDAQNKAQKKALSNVQIKGFRKGKAPENLAMKHINQGEVLNDAVNIVIPSVFTKAMEDNKLNPFIRPTVNVDKITTTELSIKFTVITYPTIEVGNYKGIKIKKDDVNVTEKDVDDAINKILESNAELIVKDGAAKLGDTVVLDFEGFVDGKPFEGGKSQNYELTLGSNQFIPGFEDQLVGTKANDKKDVNVKFPDNYIESLKGKDATFKCLVHEVKEKKIPELNDKNIEDLGLKDIKTVAELKEQQKSRILKEKQNAADNKYYEAILEKVVADSKISIAKEVIDAEVEAMNEDMHKRVEQNGLTWDQYIQILGKDKEKELNANMRKEAERNIKTMLVTNEIAKLEKITVSKEDIENEYKNLANLYNMDVKKVEEILSKDLQNFVNQIKAKKIHDKVIELNK